MAVPCSHLQSRLESYLCTPCTDPAGPTEILENTSYDIPFLLLVLIFFPTSPHSLRLVCSYSSFHCKHKSCMNTLEKVPLSSPNSWFSFILEWYHISYVKVITFYTCVMIKLGSQFEEGFDICSYISLFIYFNSVYPQPKIHCLESSRCLIKNVE